MLAMQQVCKIHKSTLLTEPTEKAHIMSTVHGLRARRCSSGTAWLETGTPISLCVRRSANLARLPYLWLRQVPNTVLARRERTPGS